MLLQLSSPAEVDRLVASKVGEPQSAADAALLDSLKQRILLALDVIEFRRRLKATLGMSYNGHDAATAAIEQILTDGRCMYLAQRPRCDRVPLSEFVAVAVRG